MTIEVVVIGAGGFGREVLDVIEAINAVTADSYEILGVADDSPSGVNLERLRSRGIRHLGTLADVARQQSPASYVIGVGSPTAKRFIGERFDQAGWSAATFIHPSATVGTRVTLEPGTVVCGGAQISTNVRAGRHVHVNPGAIIGHDAELESYVSVNPGAIVSGEVHVGAGSLIGAGSVILQGLAVGESTTVGASACVTRNSAGQGVLVGVPARRMAGTGSTDR